MRLTGRNDHHPALPPVLEVPGLEEYALQKGTDLEETIELTLLNDLETPLVLVIAGGGEEGKRLAEEYYGRYVEDPTTLTAASWA
jgi:hypothetical protein